MRPYQGGPSRKVRHQAWRGTPRGRRATHQAEAAYGRQQAERDRQARFAALTRGAPPADPQSISDNEEPARIIA